VRIEESRPLSATKRWRLIEVVQRAGDHGIPAELELLAEEAAVSEAIHSAAHPGRVKHDAEAEGDAAVAEADAIAEVDADAEAEGATEDAAESATDKGGAA
jgi:hypothetical protein